jgi:hypothetical protein
MTEISRDEAIEVFRQLAAPLIKVGSPSARDVLDQFFQFFCDTRIYKAGYDALLLEWGSMTPQLLDQFTDLRTLDELESDSTSYQWFGLSRHIVLDDEEGDSGLSLCIFMYFDPSADDQMSSSLSIEEPDHIPDALAKLIAVPYVEGLLSCSPSRINALVDSLG